MNYDQAPYSNETTSRDAAYEIAPHVPRLEWEVLNAIKTHGPLACHEIEELTGLPHTTCSARIRGLVLKNWLEDSGVKVKTPSGRSAIRWRLK